MWSPSSSDLYVSKKAVIIKLPPFTTTSSLRGRGRKPSNDRDSFVTKTTGV